MKNSNTTKQIPALLASALLLTFTSSVSFASNHTGTGNGTDTPSLAYDNSAGQSIELNYSLDYLKLSPKEIKERDQKLAPLFDYYQDATVGRAVEVLQNTFGLNIYVADETQAPSLSDKANVMASAVPMFFQDNRLRRSSPLAGADPRALPGIGMVQYEQDGQNRYMEKLIEGDSSRFSNVISNSSGFLLNMKKAEDSESNRIFGNSCNLLCDFRFLNPKVTTKYEALYSSTEYKLFEMPVISEFAQAMKDSGLKGLDATIVFVAGNIKIPFMENDGGTLLPYQVVYPQRSNSAPIPQPIVFISGSATEADILEMLQKHAPQIYVYNQLFMSNQLPSIAELELALRAQPEILRAVSDAKGIVSRDNIRFALQSAFLKAKYYAMTAVEVGAVAGPVAALAAPITIGAVVTSPIWGPIVIAETVKSLH